MTEKGIEEMEKRADAAGSSWRILAILAVGMAVGKVLLGKVGGLFRTTHSPNGSDQDH